MAYQSYLQGGNVGKARRVHIQDVGHAAVSKALVMVRAYFLKHLVQEQKIMESDKGLPKILSMLEDEGLIVKVKKEFESVSGSENRWNILTKEVSPKSLSSIPLLLIK